MRHHLYVNRRSKIVPFSENIANIAIFLLENGKNFAVRLFPVVQARLRPRLRYACRLRLHYFWIAS
jgi:hypothetical protein